jgi:hypothetical protein
MTRKEALEKLAVPPFDQETADADFDYVASKLGISTEELRGYFRLPKKFYWDYRNQQGLFNLGARVLKALGIEKSIKR